LGTVDGHISLTVWSSLFVSHINSTLPQEATHVNFRRNSDVPNDIYSHLAGILWTPEAPGQSIESLSEILSVFIEWSYGSKREPWKLDEKVVLGA
jgi:hypothetical protein